MIPKPVNVPFFKFLFAAISIAMAALVIITSFKSNLFEVLPSLNREPWFATTIVDFYFNILVISLWVMYKENDLVKSFSWVISFILLGSIATAFYVFVQLSKIKG